MDEPRPGQQRKVTDEIVEQAIVATLEERPAGRGDAAVDPVDGRQGRPEPDRGIRDLAYRIADFELSTDPQFIGKVRDVVGLYLNPPDAAVVLCVDEKTQVQALDRTAPVLPMLPGTR